MESPRSGMLYSMAIFRTNSGNVNHTYTVIYLLYATVVGIPWESFLRKRQRKLEWSARNALAVFALIPTLECSDRATGDSG